MAISGTHLSLFARSAMASIGAPRASLRPALDPLAPTDALKDATSSEYRELPAPQQRGREDSQHEPAGVVADAATLRAGASVGHEGGQEALPYVVGDGAGGGTPLVAADAAPTGAETADRPASREPLRARQAVDAYLDAAGMATDAKAGPQLDLIA